MMLGLIMAGPIAAAVVRLGMAMAALSTDWVQTVAGMVLVFVAAAMPIFMLAVTAWLGGGAGQAEQAGVMAASRAGRGAMNSMRGVAARAGRMRQRAGAMVMRGGR